MTATQTLLGSILTRRINTELLKEVKDFSIIQQTMDIFLAGDKLTIDQYSEMTVLMNPTI